MFYQLLQIVAKLKLECLTHTITTLVLCLISTYHSLQSLGVRVHYDVWVCYEASSAASYWKILIFAYLAVLQIVGLMLAFQTRKVKFKILRESKAIAAIIYISSLVLVFLGISTFALRTYINAQAAVFASGIFILTTVFLVLVFLPKV